ncbi:hypothetical protein B0H66DRAFT_268337 [Apodospora peruviana]|uniref:Uncharacterized protein n=1 Tax=Apodospora peruviana TaxID=516989 RepID=A0AAE0I6I6_9PEZI|nr:hypothetical protein B0H66DRAFT_268337 [Apodospora peruviana]
MVVVLSSKLRPESPYSLNFSSLFDIDKTPYLSYTLFYSVSTLMMDPNGSEMEPPPFPAASGEAMYLDGQKPVDIRTPHESSATASHKLADTNSNEVHENGTAKHHEMETTDARKDVKDLGWHSKDDVGNLPHYELFDGLPNEELWKLLRRFNKQMFHVKATHDCPTNDLDLEIVRQEVFTADKFRTHIERFYMTIVVDLFNLWKHIARLRSWRETRRTAVFFAFYAVAWIFDRLIASFVIFLVTLILLPHLRDVCFPHAPPAIIDGDTGGVKKPMARVLASDSLTGAPETHPGEAVEQEAHSFVNSIIEIAIGMASGQSPQDIANAKDKTGGNLTAAEQDKTKNPVSDAVWEEALPALHAIASITDTYERFGNVLSPTVPFEKFKPRLVIAAYMLVPLFICSNFVSTYMMLKGVGFVIGFGLFGDPVIRWGVEQLSSMYPHWEKFLEIKNTILKGVPTNAQLTLTLLRIGERNRSPIPPPPSARSARNPPKTLLGQEGLDELLDVPKQDIDKAIYPDPDDEKKAADGSGAGDDYYNNQKKAEQKKPKTPSRIMAAVKHLVRGSLGAVGTADRAAAKAGLKQAKFRAGAVKMNKPPEGTGGPTRFPARFDGKKGYAWIKTEKGDTMSERPVSLLGWTGGKSDTESAGYLPESEPSPIWVMNIADIKEIQKTGGLGWKSKILVGWATDGEITDGIIIRDGTGKEYHITAITLRDELFNRLVAIGDQMWESW